MSRTNLPPRRAAVNESVIYVYPETGKETRLQVTFGFDDSGRVQEVFCADFKVGTSGHATIVDGCILMSQLLQRGVRPLEIVRMMTEPLSYLGTIAKAAARIDGEMGKPSDHVDPPKSSGNLTCKFRYVDPIRECGAPSNASLNGVPYCKKHFDFQMERN